MSFDEVIAQCRARFDRAPTLAVWRELRALIEACEPPRRGDVVDYVASQTTRWWDPTRDEVVPLPARLAGDAPGMWLCAPSLEDWEALVEGRRRDTQRLVRWLALDCAAPEGHVARVLGGDLPGLAHLSLLASERDRPPRLCGELAMHPRTAQLRSLSMPLLPPDQGFALGSPRHLLRALRHVELMECSRMDDVMLIDSAAALFEAPWWSQIEGFACGALHLRATGTHTVSLYAALEANLARLPRLRGVLLGESLGLERLCEGPLLRQVTHVRLHLRHDPRGVLAVLDRLGHDPEHTVRELDLSLLSWDRLQRADHDAAQIEGIARWLKAGDHARRIDTLVLSARVLDRHVSAAHPMLLDALDDAARTSKIRVVAAPR